MKTLKSILSILSIAVVAALFSSCKKDDPTPTALTATTFKNLNADYAPAVGGTTGPPTYPTATNKFTFFSFKTGTVVANADSATTKWDVGFRSTTIIFNGGTGGPGTGGVILQSGIFSDIATAPTTGYIQDQGAKASTPALVAKSDQGWYHYDGNANVVNPIAGKVLLVKTADGKYAKMEIVSYYFDAPASPTSSMKDRYYTFRYIYQADGSTKLN